MNQDKKSILLEIEVLIRSIKVHYDNLENESRIPTIELELITSKIRKLHEKSIIYNHLHYLEEEQFQLLKRLKAEEVNHAANKNLVGQNSQNPQIQESLKPKVEPTIIEEPTIEFKSPPISAQQVSQPETQTLPEKEQIESISPANSTFKINPNINLGLNDRIWLTRELFGGNSEALNLAINTLKNCSTMAEYNHNLQQLGEKNNWKDEEALDAFKNLFKSK